MSFLVRHRIPNFCGGDVTHPNDLEHKEIQSLSELEDFEFIKGQKANGFTQILLVKVERDKYTHYDYMICTEKPGDFSSRAFVGKIVEYHAEKDDPWLF